MGLAVGGTLQLPSPPWCTVLLEPSVQHRAGSVLCPGLPPPGSRRHRQRKPRVQPSCSAARLPCHVPGRSSCPSGCLVGSPLPSCLVIPSQRGHEKSTVQNSITAHAIGEEQFAASEHGLGFGFGLAMVDSLSLLPVLAAFPAHVEVYAVGQASHRWQPSLFHQIDLWGFFDLVLAHFAE